MSGPRGTVARRVAFATCAAQPDVTADDGLLASALAGRGIEVVGVPWDDADVAWARFDAVLVRSCWDYHLRSADFLRWVDRLASMRVALWNSRAAIRWNADKRYLCDLEEGGVRTVPTVWAEAGSGTTIAEVLVRTGWRDVVIKPAVSASAHHTWRTTTERVAMHEPVFRALLAEHAMLVQPFVASVTTAGEWSLVFVDGAYSHAVVKRPKRGDFRVQGEHGGTVIASAPAARLVEAARAALAAGGHDTLYARVDGCEVDGEFRLMELELIEPALFLAQGPDTVDRLAAAIVRRLAAAHASDGGSR